MFELTTDAYFDSAHFLADYYGKCENLHGHRWKVTVGIAGELGSDGTERDMVCDFGAFKKLVRTTVEEFDHKFIVEEGTLRPETIAALEGEGFALKIVPFRTTAENFAKHFFDLLSAELSSQVKSQNVTRGEDACDKADEVNNPNYKQSTRISFVEVAETPNNRARYTK